MAGKIGFRNTTESFVLLLERAAKTKMRNADAKVKDELAKLKGIARPREQYFKNLYKKNKNQTQANSTLDK